MNLRFASLVALTTVAICAVTPTLAHHAFSAEFDAQQPIEIKGVVTKTKWVNPHSWIYLDVKAADGTITNWGFEFGTPNSLQRIGLTKASLPVGAEVLINGYHSRNGQPFGYTVSATTLADGHVYKIGQQQSLAATADTYGDKK
jgi:hypothetical protein